jgi:hypothetical protein
MAGMVLTALLAGLLVLLAMAPQGPTGEGIAFTKAFAVAAIVIIGTMSLGTAIGLRLTRRWLEAQEQDTPLVAQLKRTNAFLAQATALLKQGDTEGLRAYLAAHRAAQSGHPPGPA